MSGRRTDVTRRRAYRWIVAVAALPLLAGGCASSESHGGGGTGATGEGGSGGSAGTAFVPQTVDRADISFVDNLLVKVQDGEWTVGEGLVATLELFVGERDTDSVLRYRELLHEEGTGIIAMAHEYLASGPDSAAKEEIERLLRLLVFSGEQLEAMAGLSPPGQLAKGAPTGSEESCSNFWTDHEIPAGIDQCLRVESTTIAGKLYRVYSPAPSLPSAGWTATHYALAMEAMKEVVPKYNALGTTPSVAMVFAAENHQRGFSAAAAPNLGKVCAVSIHPKMQVRPPGDFKQILAHELGHCFQRETFPQQTDPDNLPHVVTRWREEGVAQYLSDLAYPENNLEWDDPLRRPSWLAKLAGLELSSTLFERAYVNCVFFQYLSSVLGTGGVFDVIRQLPASGVLADQRAKLAAYPGMSDLYHDFAKALTDTTVLDASNVPVPYEISEINCPTTTFTGPHVIQEDFEAFRVYRGHLAIDTDMEADLSFLPKGMVRQSARTLLGFDWRDIPNRIPVECSDIIVVVTTTQANTGFELEVPEMEDATTECACVPGKWVVNNEDVAERTSAGWGVPVSVSGQLTAEYRIDGTVQFVWSGHTFSFEDERPDGTTVTVMSTINGGGTQNYSIELGGTLLEYAGPELVVTVSDTDVYGETHVFENRYDSWAGDGNTGQLFECDRDKLVTIVDGFEIEWSRAN